MENYFIERHGKVIEQNTGEELTPGQICTLLNGYQRDGRLNGDCWTALMSQCEMHKMTITGPCGLFISSNGRDVYMNSKTATLTSKASRG